MIDRNSIAKEQARLLREKGMGYKRIAGITGLTRDAVRNTCKKIGAVQEDGTLFDRIQEGSACTYCGGAMEQHSGSGRPRRFCTENCRRQYWRLHRLEQKRREDKLFLRTCAYCGRTFQIYGKKETGGGNEKYTFRVWLNALGMKGAGYAAARAELLKNLPGNSTFRTEEQRAAYYAERSRRTAAQEPEFILL